MLGRSEQRVKLRRDPPVPVSPSPAKWDDFSWRHVGRTAAGYVDFRSRFTVPGETDLWGVDKTSASVRPLVLAEAADGRASAQEDLLMAPSDEDRKKRRARREERRRSRLEASLPPEVKSARLAPTAMRADRTAAAAAPEQASAADTERARTGVTASRSPTIGPLIIGVADGARPSGELGGGTVIRGVRVEHHPCRSPRSRAAPAPAASLGIPVGDAGPKCRRFYRGTAGLRRH